MGKYFLQRIFYMLITLLIIITITFFLMQLLPGTPFSNPEKLSEQQLKLMNAKYGLDQPLAVQYFTYVANLFQGDLGISFQSDGRTVLNVLSTRIGPSSLIGLQGMILGFILGLILGVVSALKHNTIYDYGAVFLAVIGMSIPNFVFAALLQYFVGVKLGWLPAALWKGYDHSIMPSVALSVMVIATVARFVRTEMLEVLGQDYVLTARAKGLSEFVVIIKHVLRNALIPVITVMGPLAVSILTGTLVIEKIFAVPGLGEQFTKSILVNDYSVIMGITLFFSAVFILVVFIVDVLYVVLDPRITLGKER